MKGIDDVLISWGIAPEAETSNMMRVPRDLLVRLMELAFGLKEFDEEHYLGTYRDVADAVEGGAFMSGLHHFMRIGIREGREVADRPFEPFSYLLANPDVKDAVDKGQIRSAEEHWKGHGWIEGRRV